MPTTAAPALALAALLLLAGSMSADATGRKPLGLRSLKATVIDVPFANVVVNDDGRVSVAAPFTGVVAGPEGAAVVAPGTNVVAGPSGVNVAAPGTTVAVNGTDVAVTAPSTDVQVGARGALPAVASKRGDGPCSTTIPIHMYRPPYPGPQVDAGAEGADVAVTAPSTGVQVGICGTLALAVLMAPLRGGGWGQPLQLPYCPICTAH